MAEAKTSEKTEKATPHKLRQARKQGHVIRSREFAATAGLLVALKLIIVLLPTWLHEFRRLFTLIFSQLTPQPAHEAMGSLLFFNTLQLLAQMVLPLLAIPCAIIAASLFPEGAIFTLRHVAPQLNRLNPLTHLQRMTSSQHSVDISKSMMKALILGVVLYSISQQSRIDFFALQDRPLSIMLTQAPHLVINALLTLMAVFIAFALIDLPLQTLLFQRQQRMSKQDVKEEHKTTEGRPDMKRRRRRLHHQRTQHMLRRTVPHADVVIINPNHYAVAIKYDVTRAEAPFIVAKGIDEMALSIRQIATDHALDIIGMPPLARAIYYTTQVNQQIPVSLYQAVAQVLTYILQLKAFRTGSRPNQPVLHHDLGVPREWTKL